MRYKKSFGERIFDAANHIFMIGIIIIMFYPCYYVLVASVSDPSTIFRNGGILLYPEGFGLYSYKQVLKNAQIWVGYRNTIFYVVCGSALSVALTISAAYVLSRRVLPGKNVILMLIMFTMYFGGGLIPTYLVVRGVGIYNTPLAMLLPGAVSTYNLIVTLTYFRSLPYELEDAARIDGANEFQILMRVMIPLAAPIIAVITLYYAVGMWNNYFTAMIYLKDRSLFPLQLVLREILLQGETNSMLSGTNVTLGTSEEYAAYVENIKFAVIVVSTIPIMCVYPFLQRYFVKGVMIGAVKE